MSDREIAKQAHQEVRSRAMGCPNCGGLFVLHWDHLTPRDRELLQLFIQKRASGDLHIVAIEDSAERLISGRSSVLKVQP